MSIKVGSSGGAKSVGSTKKTSQTQSAGGSFSSFLDGADGVTSSGVSAGVAVGGIEALLIAQGIGDATDDAGDRKKRAVAHGNDLLDRLEDLRAALLAGSVPKSKLIELAQALREKRDPSLDPKLNSLLDDIELRAEVELAKLTRNV